MLNKFATPGARLRLIVKYGGNAAGATADDALLREIADLRAAGHVVVLVHGGGPEIDDALVRQGLPARRVNGLRVTDAEALRVVEAVLCGTANKRLVRACLARGIAAVGISGQDGGLVKVRRARSSPGPDLGFVGEIVAVDPAPLIALLEAGYLPVVSPVAIDENAEHAYNVNADTVAGALAAALKADAYIALTDVDHVLLDPKNPYSAINSFCVADALRFAATDACAGGMKPKMLAAVAAVAGGASRAYICAAKPGAIAAALCGQATTIAETG